MGPDFLFRTRTGSGRTLRIKGRWDLPGDHSLPPRSAQQYRQPRTAPTSLT